MNVWNHGDKPIFIVTEYEVDPSGGPASHKSAVSIAPGEGIDLELLGLRPIKPELMEPRAKND